jgi:hypothetical protein
LTAQRIWISWPTVSIFNGKGKNAITVETNAEEYQLLGTTWQIPKTWPLHQSSLGLVDEPYRRFLEWENNIQIWVKRKSLDIIRILVTAREDIGWNVDRVLANQIMNQHASQGTSNILIAWFLELGCKRQARV